MLHLQQHLRRLERPALLRRARQLIYMPSPCQRPRALPGGFQLAVTRRRVQPLDLCRLEPSDVWPHMRWPRREPTSACIQDDGSYASRRAHFTCSDCLTRHVHFASVDELRARGGVASQKGYASCH